VIRPARFALIGALLASLSATSACMSMPEAGKVVETGDEAGIQPDDPADIVVAGPRAGESATDIVVHFLDAMTASPINPAVARDFLTEDAAAAWDPKQRTITYADKSQPVGSSPIDVSLIGAQHLDARGTWQGPLAPDRSTLHFVVELENGEYRIASAPNALIVPQRWFEQRFQQVLLYFFEPTAEVLVPEPVYLPRGSELPTALTRDLLLGPPDGLARVERTFFPRGMTARPFTIEPDSKVADVVLEGDASQLSTKTTELMLAQLAWTLRQVPGLTALSVSVGGEPVILGTDDQEFPIGEGAEFDPNGILASPVPFALRAGLLVSGPLEAMESVSGPFGTKDYDLHDIAVDPTSNTVAAVTAAGTALVVGPVHQSSRAVEEVVSGATDLLKPSWDLAGRLWLIDRRTSGALVSVVLGDQAPLRLEAPGITGERVKTFLVSRDGTRLVALLDGRTQDSIVMSRIQRGDGGLATLGPATQLPWNADGPVDIVDIGWRSPTSIAVLHPLTDELSQVRTLALDGSPGTGQLPSTTPLRGGWRWLVSSPVETEPLYVVGNAGVAELSRADSVFRPARLNLASITYVG
jgi:hypothetical protein